MADWVTISALATAGGTLALAATTYASVRSANRASRVAELSLMAGMRPLLVESAENDPVQHVSFKDVTSLEVPGGGAYVGEADGNVYVVLSLKNVGPGIAVLHGGRVYGTQLTSRPEHSPIDEMRSLMRDLYIAAGGVGYYQIAFRAADNDLPEGIREAIAAGVISVEVLYGDYEGGQRVISRYGVRVVDGHWQVATIRHWQLDRQEVRSRD